MIRILLLFSILGALSLFSCAGNGPPPDFPTQAWSSTTPEVQGFDSAKLAEGLRAIRAKDIHIHSLLLIRNGKVLLDASFYPYDGKSVHDLASVTKSVMTTLIAIAADQSKLKLDDPVVSFFPDRTIANLDPRKKRLTVRQLANMANGMESLCSANDEGTLTEMMASPNWVQFALDRKMTSEPGSTFCYDSPGMHLLSAILQKATGLTALEFARQNLFAPLGIREVIWPTDPQGYNRGWGDIHLNARDAAKLGYLWLNKGVWEGKQIVSRAWVEDAVKGHIQTSEKDDYGYGWWVSKGNDVGDYAAIGRGGQRIQLVPALNIIVVTTGGGFDWDTISPFLVAALVNPKEPLAANPSAVAQLDAALIAIAQPPPAKVVAPLPEIAHKISGKTFVFESNPLQLKTLRLGFDESSVAKMQLTFAYDQPTRDGIIGLDGVYRMTASRNNLPVGACGYWADDHTFIVEYDEIANNEAFMLRMQFDVDGIVVDVKERTREAGLTLKGQ